MEAKELRIGNLAMLDNDILEVSAIKEAVNLENEHRIFFKNEHRNKPASHIKPIPLTEEWLLKFGFEKTNAYGGRGYKLCNLILFRVQYNSLIADKKDEAYEVEFCANRLNFKERTHIIKRLDYVHQLQNLYFALTGNELTIKE